MKREIIHRIVPGLFTLALLLVLSLEGQSQEKAATTDYFTDNGKAIRGYDPVSYFTGKQPEMGRPEFTYTWQGVIWQFTNREHLELFKSDPDQYAPRFGGYCAYGVSENHKSPTDPLAWTIVGGRLYLNYSVKVKELWIRDTTERIRQGNENWKTLSSKNHAP